MERIVTGAQAKLFDRKLIEAGTPSLSLMRTAAQGIADTVRERFGTERPVTAICGTGNNGGDGIAAAGLLKRCGIEASVVLIGDAAACTPDTAFYLDKAKETGVSIRQNWKKAENEILIDALFGVGLNRPIEGVYRALIEQMNASGCPIVSADMPSGLHADSGRILGAAVHAAATVTMQTKKAGMLLGKGRELCGDVIVQPLTSQSLTVPFTIAPIPAHAV